jgi:DNA polymerase-3 subunit gamma/tau
MPVWRVVLLLALLGCGAAPAAPPGSGGVAMDSGGQATTSAGALKGGMSSGGAAAGVSAGGGGAGGEGGGPLGGTPGGASGAGGAAGGLALCGEPSVPEPEPAVAPAAVAVDASAKTLLKSGNFDDAGTDVLAPSAAAGVVLGTRCVSEIWKLF